MCGYKRGRNELKGEWRKGGWRTLRQAEPDGLTGLSRFDR